MEDNSPFFKIEEEIEIDSIKDLLEITKKKSYGTINPDPFSQLKAMMVFPQTYEHHKTSGIFRGQRKDWPLIPASYRNLATNKKESISDIDIRYQHHRTHSEYIRFCEMAERHNHNFPKSPIERMCIAQHYGITTPLLDWTTNILVALYFSLEYKQDDDRNDGFELFIYHLKDERFLEKGIEKVNDLYNVSESSLVEAPTIDRRIDRQFAVFSYHPVPLKKPKKIPLTKYRISENLFFDVRDMIEGFRYSSAYFFPDYAGLVDRIKKGYMI